MSSDSLSPIGFSPGAACRCFSKSMSYRVAALLIRRTYVAIVVMVVIGGFGVLVWI